MRAARWIEARYAGRCNCGASFKRERVTACPKCNHEQASQGPSDRQPDPVDTAYEDQCAAACGLTGGRD